MVSWHQRSPLVRLKVFTRLGCWLSRNRVLLVDSFWFCFMLSSWTSTTKPWKYTHTKTHSRGKKKSLCASVHLYACITNKNASKCMHWHTNTDMLYVCHTSYIHTRTYSDKHYYGKVPLCTILFSIQYTEIYWMGYACGPNDNNYSENTDNTYPRT